MALGARIKKARFSAGMTQAALARATGVSERNIVRWENDQHAPRFEHVAAIAAATGRDVDYFTAPELSSETEDEEAARVPTHHELLDALRPLAELFNAREPVA